MFTAISTASYYPLESEQAAFQAAWLGYRAIEIFVNSEHEFEDAFVDRVRNRLEELGVRINSVHPYTSGMEPFLLFSEYERRRSEAVEYYKAKLRAAARYGAKYFVLHGPSDPRGEREPNEIEKAVYGELTAEARKVGVTVAQENVRLFLSRYPSYTKALKSEFEIGFNLDIKQARLAGLHENDYLDAAGDILVNVHINDLDEAGHCRLPGRGRVDYDALLDRLGALEYCGALVTEVYRGDYETTDDLIQSKLFLEERLRAQRPSKKKGPV